MGIRGQHVGEMGGVLEGDTGTGQLTPCVIRAEHFY